MRHRTIERKLRLIRTMWQRPIPKRLIHTDYFCQGALDLGQAWQVPQGRPASRSLQKGCKKVPHTKPPKSSLVCRISSVRDRAPRPMVMMFAASADRSLAGGVPQ